MYKKFKNILCALGVCYVVLDAADNPAHISIFSPLAGEQYFVGDTLEIRFTADSTVRHMMISIHFKGFPEGQDAYPFGFNASSPDTSEYSSFKFEIPETMFVLNSYGDSFPVSTISDSVDIRVFDAFNKIGDIHTYKSGYFSIKPVVRAEKKSTFFAKCHVAISPNPAQDFILFDKPISNVKMFALDGKIVKYSQNTTIGTLSRFDISSMPTGVYLCNFEVDNGLVVNKKIIVQK